MCKFVKKTVQNHKIKVAKGRCEKAAIMASKCARAFEDTGNHELADFWWGKYNNLYDAIQAANTVL